MSEQVNEQASAANDAQTQNWVAGQIRAAILLGLSVYAKQAAAAKAGVVSGNGANAIALECAAYAEAAIWRLKSVQECGGQGTARPTKPDSESQVGGGVPSAPLNEGYLVKIEAFLVAEHAAGRFAALGYWNTDKKWVSRTAVQFVKDLKTAYAQRAAIRRGR